jgi:hypothetical protein
MKAGFWIAKMLILCLLVVGLIGFITMSLWNWLVPDLFHGPEINYWQALGLFILSKILLSSFGGKGRHHNGHWKPYWKNRWASMSPEDRERFKQKMNEKWCRPGQAPSTGDSGSSTV